MNNFAAYVKAFTAFVVLLLIQALSQLVTLAVVGENSSMFSAYSLLLFALSSAVVFAIWYYKQNCTRGGETEYVKDIRKLSPKAGNIIPVVIFGVSVQLFMCVLLGIILSFFPKARTEYQSGISGIVGFNALLAVYTCFLGPVCEEFAFRGVIFEILERESGFALANVVQAVLFGVYHGNFIQGVYAFLFGIIFGYIKKYTGSLYYVILLHVVINIAGFIVSLLNIESISLPAELVIMLVFGAVSFVCFSLIKKRNPV